jgi:hypothetical protein
VAKDCWTANIFIKVMCVLSVVIRARARFLLLRFGLLETRKRQNPKLFFLCVCEAFRNVRVRSAEYRRLRTRTDDREETPQNLA